jgi:hypothetical protein
MKDSKSQYSDTTSYGDRDIDTLTTISFLDVEVDTTSSENDIHFNRVNLFDDYRNQEVGEAFYIITTHDENLALDSVNPENYVLFSNFFIHPNPTKEDIEAEARRRFASINFSTWDEFYDKISDIFCHDWDD